MMSCVTQDMHTTQIGSLQPCHEDSDIWSQQSSKKLLTNFHCFDTTGWTSDL